ADGLWSTVRQSVKPGSVPRPAGATAMRSVIPAEAAGGLGTGVVGVWLSPVAHVVHYPVRAGRDVAVVVIARSDSTQHDRAAPRSVWDAQASLPRLQATLAPFHASLRNVLLPELVPANSPPRVPRATTNGAARITPWRWREWTLHTLPPLRTWRRGRVALIGDAAHPMLPYLAQGGALALEDAVVMGHCLHETDDPVAALARFDSLRAQRAARVQAASRRQGGIYHLSPPLSWARDAVLAAAPGNRLMVAYDWLYAWRPPEAVAGAQGVASRED
ncbi:MAG TPA: FAD-dependent monooxygenase, partial [Hyphomicrobiaceae bacterium]|nr:FAD-dependent monooxygenase [Hyphomicrobiaceae bacterium]